jgi:hypothetical protein
MGIERRRRRKQQRPQKIMGPRVFRRFYYLLE